MSFLAQLYAPADDDLAKPSPSPTSYHRSLYVFICSNGKCKSTTGSVSVLRCQLPQINPYYPTSTKLATMANSKCVPSQFDNNLCALCGQSSSKKCPQQNLFFCGKLHQKEYSRLNKGSGRTKNLLFKEVLLEIEEEYLSDDDINDGDGDGDGGEGAMDGLPKKQSLKEKMNNLALINDYSTTETGNGTETLTGTGTGTAETTGSSVEVGDSDEEDLDDETLEQCDVNKMTGSTGVSDETTINFMTKIAQGGSDQCLRYCRWNNEALLWTSDEGKCDSSAVPRCSTCNSERKFEFQIMPQMLHFLQVENKSEEISAKIFKEKQDASCDFGTIAVYTCVNSCDGGGKEGEGAYQAEYAWRQTSGNNFLEI